MDWLNRARQFVGNLFGGAQRTIGQISGNVARAVGQAEQQAARTAQQVVRQIPQPPRIQLPQIPQVQMPRFQAPRVQLPQAPKVDFGAVSRALQGTQKQVGQFGEGVNIGFKQFTGQQLTPREQQVVDFAKQQVPTFKLASNALQGIQQYNQQLNERTKQIQLEKLKQLKENPATAIAQNLLGPLNILTKTGEVSKALTGKDIVPKIDTTKAVNDLTKSLANSPLKNVPGIGVVSDIVNPIAKQIARGTDVLQNQEQYSKGLKGMGEFGSDLATVISLFYAGGLSKQLATKGTAFLPTAARLAPRLAASGAGQNILQQISEGKKLNEIDPKQVATAAALYTGLGVGIPGVTRGVSAGLGKALGKGQAGLATQAARALPTDKNALVIAGSLPEKGALRAQGYTNVKVQFQPKPGQVAPTMQGAIPQVAPKAPKGQEALFAEARKYKSADEFVKAQGTPVYHGTMANFDTFDPKKLGSNTGAVSAKEGFFFTPQKEVARTYVAKGSVETGSAMRTQGDINNAIEKLTGDKQSRAAFKMLQEDMFGRDSGYSPEVKTKLNKLLDQYAKAGDKIAKYEDSYFMPSDSLQKAKGSKIVEAYVKLENPLVIDAKGANRTPADYTDALRRAKKDGHDGVIIKNTFDRQHDLIKDTPHEIRVAFKQDSIKTKSQLTDIYNQANKKQ